MIKIDGPAMAINDKRVGGHVRMDVTWNVAPDVTREEILQWIVRAAADQPNGRLKSLVLNSHGVPGYMILGEGFWKPHVGMFHRLAGHVDVIWIMACRIAQKGGLRRGDRLNPDWNAEDKIGDGFMFCRDIAMNASCFVVASTFDQNVPTQHRIPNHYIDSFEGTLMCFKPDGSLAWSEFCNIDNGE